VRRHGAETSKELWRFNRSSRGRSSGRSYRSILHGHSHAPTKNAYGRILLHREGFQAEKDIAVRLSTVYHVQPALVVSNDGTTPLRITKIYIGSDSYPADITINPGEKRTLPIAVGVGQKVAVEVEGWGVVVLQTVGSTDGGFDRLKGSTGPALPYLRCSTVPLPQCTRL
jgi:hypothetical protein